MAMTAARTKLLLVSLAAVLTTAQVPTGFVARWRADGIANAQISAGEITSWRDDSGLPANAIASSLRPRINRNSLFCRSTVRFQDGRGFITATTGSVSVLDPGSGEFTVFMLNRQLNYNQWGTVLFKGTGSLSWEFSHGVGGGFSMAYIFRGGIPQNAASHTTYQDYKWETWMMAIERVAPGSDIKGVMGSRSHTRDGWKDGGLNSYTNRYPGSVGSATPLYIGASPGTPYAGDVAEILIYNRKLTAAEQDSVWNYFDSQYYLTCPALVAVNGVNGNVAAGKAFCFGYNASYGNECQQACSVGLVRTYGSFDHLCLVGEWTGSNLVCERECPPLSAPPFYAGCSRSMVTVSSWTSDAVDLDRGTFATAPAVPRSERANYWTVAGGLLTTNALNAPCAVGRPSLLYMVQPRWADTLLPSMAATVSVMVTPSVGTLGVAFRAADADNYYLLRLGTNPNPASGWAALTRFKTGLQPLTFANATVAFMPGIAYAVNISMLGSSFTVSVGGATPIVDASNADLQYGGVGFYSEGVGSFGAYSIMTECDSGGSCTLATPGIGCNHTCAPGYVLVAGSAARMCTSMPDGSSQWSGSPAICSLTPPRFVNTSQVLTVPENSLPDTNVGAPIVAVTSASRVSILYTIDAEYPPSGDVNNPRFAIGACSGQVYVLNGSSLDFETQPTYTITVTASPTGFPASAVSANFTIQLLNMPERPYFAGANTPVAYRTVPEDAALGTFVGAPVTAVDPDVLMPFPGDNITYSLEIDPSNGVLAVNPASGQVYVARVPGLDFETAPQYALRLRAQRSLFPALFDVTQVSVAVSNANDPPTMPATQIQEILPGDAFLGNMLPFPIGYTDQDTGDAHSFTIVSGNAEPVTGITPVFTLNNTAGTLTWAVDRSSWPPDAPTFVVGTRLVYTVYTLIVSVTDSGGKSASGRLVVYLMVNGTQPGGGVVAAPVIDSIAVGTASGEAGTMGGDVVTMTGSNLPLGSSVVATYGITSSSAAFARNYSARSCSVASPTTLTCVTAPGVGRDLSWDVAFIDPLGGRTVATRTAPLLMSYEAPEVLSIRGGLGMPTPGGAVITITGTNFGEETRLVAFNYGPSLTNRWMSARRIVSANHTQIVLESGEGAGSGLLFTLTVGGQDAPAVFTTLSHTPAAISRISIVGGTFTTMTLPWQTWTLLVEGRNFGPSAIPGTPSGQTPFFLRYGQLPFAGIDYIYPMSTVSCVKSGTPHISMRCTAYPVTSAGTNMTVQPVIAGVSGSMSHRSMGIPAGYIGHMQPLVTGVSGTGTYLADTAGGQTIIISGSGFGPLGFVDPGEGTISPVRLLVRYGSTGTINTSVPGALNDANFEPAYRFGALACSVTKESTRFDTSATIQCSSSAGIGTDLELAVMMGNLFSLPQARAVSYGPPIISYFEGPGAAGADTRGSQNVTIVGKNFYNDASLLQVSYTLALDGTVAAGLPNGAYVLPAAADAESEVTFVLPPGTCSYAIPHSAITCATSPGAGSNLKWTLVVAGQSSRDPFTYYASPMLLNVTTAPPGDPTAASVTAADPAGGTIAYISGLNLGPGTNAGSPGGGPSGYPGRLLQWLRYSLPGSGRFVYLPPANYTVLDHNLIQVRIGPGYGQNLAFDAMVGDQQSSGSATFSYRRPRLLSVTPLSGISTNSDPLMLTLVAVDLPGETAAVTYSMQLGQDADGTIEVSSCAIGGSSGSAFGIATTLRCPVPEGWGRARQVQLLLTDRAAGAAVVASGGPFFFDYSRPTLSFFTDADPTVEPWATAVASAWADTTGVRIVTIQGAGIGPAGGYGNLQSVRALLVNGSGISPTTGIPIGTSGGQIAALQFSGSRSSDADVGPVATIVYSYTPNAIVLMTKLATLRVQLSQRVLASDGATPLTTTSNSIDLSRNQPRISGLVGPLTGYTVGLASTQGVLSLEIPYGTLDGITSLLINITSYIPQADRSELPFGAQCAILNRDWVGTSVGDSTYSQSMNDRVAPSTRAATFAVRTCTNYWSPALPTDNTPCRLHCEILGGQGDNAQVSLTTDGEQSPFSAIIGFAPPAIRSVTVTDVDGSSVTYDLLSNPTAVVTLPTVGGVVSMTGSDFGAYPNVLIGPSGGPGVSNYGVYTLGALAAGMQGIAVSATSLTVPSLPGEGAADPYNLVNGLPVPFSLRLQTSRNQFSMQPSGLPVRMAWAAPVITGFTATAPAAGGTMMNITGRNFGAAVPGIPSLAPTVLFLKSDGLPPLQCGSVMRWSHAFMTCVVPAGAGANFTVAVTVANQTGVSPSWLTFSYARPVITSVMVESWPAAVYNNWPVLWNTNRSALSGNGSAVRTTGYGVRGAHGPTNGRYLVTLSGANFGSRAPGVSCVFASHLYSYVDCSSPVNAGALQCICTSDAAAGSNPGCQQSFIALQAAATLGRTVFQAVCDGFESYAGEGEVHDTGGLAALSAAQLDATRSNDAYASGFIWSWSDSQIVFSMPPGAGVAVVTVGARGQFPWMHQEALFAFDTPQLGTAYRITGSLGTAGGDLLLISGSNLGLGFPLAPESFALQPAVPVQLPGTSAPLTTLSVNEPSIDTMFAAVASRRSLPLAEGAIVPAYGATLRWWIYCLSNARIYDVPRPSGGYAKPPFLSGCPNRNETAYTIVRHRHDSILIRTHPGIGARRNASLEVHTDVNLVTASQPLPFAYDAPAVRAYRPSNIYLVGDSPFTFTTAGINFGNLGDNTGWTPEDNVVAVTVDGVPVNGTARQLPSVDDAALGYGIIAGNVDWPTYQTMGAKTVTVQVAGQVGVHFANATLPSPAVFGCKPGFYGNVSETCLGCPSGAVCAGYDVIRSVHTYPRPQAFFFNLNGSMFAEACPPDVAAASGGRSVCIVSCIPGENCAGDNLCTVGYRSLAPLYRCTACDKGFYRRNSECVRCPDSPGMVVVGLALLAIFLAGVAYFFNKYKVNVAFTAVAIDYFQVVAMFVATRVPWPKPLRELLQILQAFNLNIEIAVPECLVPSLDYQSKWGGIMLLPLIAGAFFLLTFLGRYLFARYVKGQRGRDNLLAHADGLIASFLTLFYFMYLYLSRTLLEPFNCVAAPGKDDGLRYMAATGEPCGGPMQRSLVPPAVIGLLVYTIGFPAFVAWTLYRHRFWIMEEQLLLAHSTRSDRVLNRSKLWLHRRYSRLYYAFKPDFWFWSLAIIARKFGIALVAMLFRSEPGFQLAMALLFLFVAFAAQVRSHPYMSDKAETLRTHERLRFEDDIHARLAEQIKSSVAMARKRGKARINWSAPRAEVALALLGSAGAWLSDLNTLESVLLAASVMIALAGIMFIGLSTSFLSATAAGNGIDPVIIENATRVCSPTYVNYCNGLVAGVILLITATIVYLLAVIIAEVVAACKEYALNRASAAQRDAMLRAAKAKAKGSGKRLGRRGSTSGPDGGFIANIGVVEESLNPLFSSSTTGEANISSDVPVDATGALSILQAENPPNKPVWNAIQGWCRTALENAEEQAQAIAVLKRQLAQLELEVSRNGKRKPDVSMAEMGSYKSSRTLSIAGAPSRKVFNPTISASGEREREMEMATVGSAAAAASPSGAGAGADSPAEGAAAAAAGAPALLKAPSRLSFAAKVLSTSRRTLEPTAPSSARARLAAKAAAKSVAGGDEAGASAAAAASASAEDEITEASPGVAGGNGGRGGGRVSDADL